jgi:hypothetical protein
MQGKNEKPNGTRGFRKYELRLFRTFASNWIYGRTHWKHIQVSKYIFKIVVTPVTPEANGVLLEAICQKHGAGQLYCVEQVEESIGGGMS